MKLLQRIVLVLYSALVRIAASGFLGVSKLMGFTKRLDMDGYGQARIWHLPEITKCLREIPWPR